MAESSIAKKIGSESWLSPAPPVVLWAAVVVVMVGVISMPLATAQFDSFADLKGDYCRVRRPTSCCDGRYDDCSMPIRGTRCYCDQFCNRTSNPDCCPDYWELCLGFRPLDPLLDACFKDGVVIPVGQSYKFNCNECKCQGGQLLCDTDPCMIDEQVIENVNRGQRQYTWRASNYSAFWGRKARDGLLLRTGTHNPEALSMKMYPILLRPELSRIPSRFDVRNKRDWRGRVSEVRDQGWCGASWAFSTLGVTQDRLSIESLGNETVTLAPQHLLSCDRRGQSGCNGGHVDRAWQYLRKFGVVNEECYEYESGRTGKLPRCRIPRNANLFNLRCSANDVVYQRRNLYRTEPAYRISGKEVDIQWEILTNGPVQAMMKVHKDLFMYQSGVYSHTRLTGEETATHSVRIIGWGEDNTVASPPVKYWLVANSWGTDWGERGYFRIARGYNESDIESFIIAVRVRLGEYATGGRRRALRRPGRRNYSNRLRNYRAKN
ncbi:uncharacterized peptidase C1-like protein F26E4.3 [Homarus americanus]|uniref:uncharacterized peptidase C1-like protein F26E4.3 n=1 Tax=Homarus americanus TaxID=6706 RepID=UPI001C465DA6|nr:uncharacterized peptidase C1-like protein F26E4.3 [Homarus americanus]XP_042204648.1 uncharacterized peptidase C1-like protein F26E4.3 [Homarus americanus]XP_042204649.1 uncharacterized peptidase C1-like protein F26E4.3 [Homarus americanus]XP_042204650.1 uncharacterized peptidase C1-like protein F26E4.3 [Homarus americanus]XP_042204651.1 uncharacterized peptidase C1-like protein F26E4.3 [Homarus americanus]XP_042204652.1 uncharacterized peptidase C1-like protein F26E4.3 [Homarus americanus]